MNRNEYPIAIAEHNSSGIQSVAAELGITHMRLVASGQDQRSVWGDVYALPHPDGHELRVLDTDADPVWDGEDDPQDFAETCWMYGLTPGQTGGVATLIPSRLDAWRQHSPTRIRLSVCTNPSAWGDETDGATALRAATNTADALESAVSMLYPEAEVEVRLVPDILPYDAHEYIEDADDLEAADLHSLIESNCGEIYETEPAEFDHVGYARRALAAAGLLPED